MARAGGIAQSLDRFLDLLQRVFSRHLVLFGLLGVEHQGEPPPAFSLADDDLFDGTLCSMPQANRGVIDL